MAGNIHAQDKSENIRNGVEQSENPQIEVKDVVGQDLGASENVIEVESVSTKGEDPVTQGSGFGDTDSSGDVNMEASIKSDDVVRAGGFGARDDLSSLLPVAVDSTDFEASLRNARDYEEAQGEICRPGLGWNDTTESE